MFTTTNCRWNIHKFFLISQSDLVTTILAAKAAPAEMFVSGDKPKNLSRLGEKRPPHGKNW